jgi:hypothetical protein
MPRLAAAAFDTDVNARAGSASIIGRREEGVNVAQRISGQSAEITHGCDPRRRDVLAARKDWLRPSAEAALHRKRFAERRLRFQYRRFDYHLCTTPH